MSENTTKKVAFTVRFDHDFNEQINEFVHQAGKGLPPNQKPSKDKLIQDAVRATIAASSPGEIANYMDRRIRAVQKLIEDGSADELFQLENLLHRYLKEDSKPKQSARKKSSEVRGRLAG
jgi:hypothetical protein